MFRAWLILALANGFSNRAIEKKLGTTAPTIPADDNALRNTACRTEGAPPGQPAAGGDSGGAGADVRRTLQASGCRKLAAELGMNKSSVQRVWNQAKLKPHRLECYMASDDPEFLARLGPAATRGRFLRGREDGNPGARPTRSGAAAVAEPSPTP